MNLLRLQEVYAVTIASIGVGATPTVTTDEAHGFEDGESVTLDAVNASLTGLQRTISSIGVGATPTVTTDDPHDFTDGENVTLANVDASLTGGANASHVITVTGASTFTIPITTGGSYTPAADTATQDDNINAAHVVTVLGDKTFSVPVTTTGTYTAATDTATKDVAGFLHGHANATIKSSSAFLVSSAGLPIDARARLLVHAKNAPAAGNELTVKAWGRLVPTTEFEKSRWVLLATLDESGSFGQLDSGDLFGGVSDEFAMMPQMRISTESTAGSANAFEVGILVSKTAQRPAA